MTELKNFKHYYFKKLFSYALVLLCIFSISPHAYAAKNRKHPPSKEFLDFLKNGLPNEKVLYDMSFLWFKKAAEGRVFIKKVSDNEFVAKMEAETKGFIGWIMYVRHTYISHMKITKDNNLRCELFERTVVKGGKEERTISKMDYSARKLNWQRYINGELAEEGSSDIPDGTVYEDILSAYYKFRFGLYGEIIKGKEYLINTIPQNGADKIIIKVAAAKEEAEQIEKIGFTKGLKYLYLGHIVVPKELFGTKQGIVKVLFGQKVIPVEGMVKDAIGFGNVWSYLRSTTLDEEAVR